MLLISHFYCFFKGFFFSGGPDVEKKKNHSHLKFNLILPGRAASRAKEKKNTIFFFKIYAAARTLRVLAYIIVFFF